MRVLKKAKKMNIRIFKEISTQIYRDFRYLFFSSIEHGRVEEGFCFDILVRLHENLEGNDIEKRETVNDFAESMIECIDNHLRCVLRKEFEKIGMLDDTDPNVLIGFDGKSMVYEECFRAALEGLKRYNALFSRPMIEKATMEKAKNGFAHFSTLLFTYRNLLEIETTTEEGSLRSEISQGWPE
ncbi:hypothetical protein [Hydrogenimonas urashimensis]|uniref:hypothetical protein n=1 Tax=Hydrogenimonas urashimensis TaxID=2740515 RepID=UPI00191551A6|nr:hypothetical protein [Hydrogenimonas urashimensis]